MSSGGPRKGAGRKRKSVKHATAIEQAETRIRDRLPEIIGLMFELAAGVTVQTPNEDGTVEVYTEKPDLRACMYLTDRIMGRPDMRVKAEHSGTVAWVSRVDQQRALADPTITRLQCEVDARYANLHAYQDTLDSGPDDGGAMGEPSLGG